MWLKLSGSLFVEAELDVEDSGGSGEVKDDVKFWSISVEVKLDTEVVVLESIEGIENKLLSLLLVVAAAAAVLLALDFRYSFGIKENSSLLSSSLSSSFSSEVPSEFWVLPNKSISKMRIIKILKGGFPFFLPQIFFLGEGGGEGSRKNYIF